MSLVAPEIADGIGASLGIAVHGIFTTQDLQRGFILPFVKLEKSSLNIGVIVAQSGRLTKSAGCFLMTRELVGAGREPTKTVPYTSSCPSFAKSTASVANLDARSSSISRVILWTAVIIDE